LTNAENEVAEVHSNIEDIINSSEEDLASVQAQRNQYREALDAIADEEGGVRTHAELRTQLHAANAALEGEQRAREATRTLLAEAQDATEQTSAGLRTQLHDATASLEGEQRAHEATKISLAEAQTACEETKTNALQM
jgi:hypothetical protein